MIYFIDIGPRFPPELHRMAQEIAAATGYSVSDILTEAAHTGLRVCERPWEKLKNEQGPCTSPAK